MKKALFIIAVFFSLSSFAQIPEPISNTYVNDLTKSLTWEQIRVLNDSILSIEKRTSVQIAVLLISNLPANYEIEDYAREVGKKWGVGNAKNGIVYVASLDEHKQRLEVAQNVEGDIPDVTAMEITENLKPYLRSKDYSGAMLELVKEINNHVDPVAKEQLRLAAIENEKREKKLGEMFLSVLFIVAGLGIAGFTIYYFFFLPGIKRRKKEQEEAEEAERESQRKQRSAYIASLPPQKKAEPKKYSESNNAPIIPIIAPSSYDSSSSYKSSSDDSSSSYGSWGGGSSSGDSGFSGGGASNDW